MEKQIVNDELKSLNKGLPVFDVKKLEERLETDPLVVSGLFNLHTDETVNVCQSPSEWCLVINVCGED